MRGGFRDPKVLSPRRIFGERQESRWRSRRQKHETYDIQSMGSEGQDRVVAKRGEARLHAPAGDEPVVIAVLGRAQAVPAEAPRVLDALAAEGFAVVHLRVGLTASVGAPLEPARHGPEALQAFAAQMQQSVWPSLQQKLVIPERGYFAAYLPAVWVGSDGVQLQWPSLGVALMLASWEAPPWLVLTEEAPPAWLLAEPKIVAHRLECLTERLGWEVGPPGPPVVPATLQWGSGAVAVVGDKPAPDFTEALAQRLAPIPVVAAASVRPAPAPEGVPNLAVVPDEELSRMLAAAWVAVVPPGDGAPEWAEASGSWPPQVGGQGWGAWPATTLDEYERAVALAAYARAHQPELPDVHPVSAALASLAASRCEVRS